MMNVTTTPVVSNKVTFSYNGKKRTGTVIEAGKDWFKIDVGFGDKYTRYKTFKTSCVEGDITLLDRKSVADILASIPKRVYVTETRLKGTKQQYHVARILDSWGQVVGAQTGKDLGALVKRLQAKGITRKK